ncbi:tetratricopeptide repeat protein [Methylobacterium sp. J-078]|uniref:tetratricopeptide repeat protein n=1 Tax=Methylobacterium sp. J-078 TaxID=2836657 RepID=UPI001FBA1AD9|nr:tetratricopeptide repeat protein [Methylobacterium sp. J-078]MCJ2045946.1 tetratricopeptide repeat protein [Methylobacterium sp. J-078]
MTQRPVDEARAFLERGLLTEAVAILRALEQCTDPDPDVLALLGVARAMQGQLVEAEGYVRAALRVAPHVASLHCNLGNLLREQGRFGEAEACLRQALALRPNYVDARNNLGATQRALGRLDDAEASFRDALRLQPNLASALKNLGALLLTQKRFAEAGPVWAALTRLQPLDLDGQVALAQCLRGCGRLPQAETILSRVLDVAPAHVAALIEQGSTHYASGRFDEAGRSWRSAAALDPQAVEAAHGLGVLAARAGDYADAETHLRRAITPEGPYPEALNSLGDVLRNLGRFEEAESLLRMALELRPAYPEAQVSLAFLLLQTGRPSEGWAAYEARWQVEPWISQARHAHLPPWSGEAIAGKTLLVHAEQGLGDTLQFVRYINALPSGARILLQVQAPLVRLLTSQFAGRTIDIIGPEHRVDHADYQVPLLSLPHRLGGAPADLTAGSRSLTADPQNVAVWRARLSGLQGLRVGLVWAGNPTLTADARRSIGLDALAPLGGIAGLRLVSLQWGAGLRDVPAGLDLYDAAAHVSDLADTAAAIACLDLVIGVDTAVAHLAASLGRPVWLLNRRDTCWRWGPDEGANAWYPTLREYRQVRQGEWSPVVARVCEDLRDAVRRGAV